MNNEKYVVGIGAANLDIMGRSKASLVSEDSNPGIIEMSVGGATHNVCENAARLSVPIRFISVTGDDYYGELIRSECKEAGLGSEEFIVLKGESSSSYMSVHDPSGDMAIAVSDMRILQKITIDDLKARKTLLEGASAIIFDTGLPEPIIDYLMETYRDRLPIFVDPVSTTYARKMVGRLNGIHTLKPNRLEAEILAKVPISNEEDIKKAADAMIAQGLKRVFISLGKDGVYYADENGNHLHRRMKPLDSIANATGAGDCFMGALLYAYMNCLPIEETIDFAMAASVLAISSEKTINDKMSAEAVLELMHR